MDLGAKKGRWGWAAGDLGLSDTAVGSTNPGGRGTLRDVKTWNDIPLLSYHTSGVVVGTALGGEGARHRRRPK